MMKLLTLNTHSLVEEHGDKKLLDFVEMVAAQKPEVIALQEVNQTLWQKPVPKRKLKGFYACDDKAVIRADNYVYRAAELLRGKGLYYEWTWLPLKKGYDKYDEGIALMSLLPITGTDILPVSSVDDYYNWKTRKLLGISIGREKEEWFFSVHFGWWKDEEEPFWMQWKRADYCLPKNKMVWLLGDFNNPAQIREEGYDCVRESGWQDSFLLAEQKDDGITVEKAIDGWREEEKMLPGTKHNEDKKTGELIKNGMRIDQIWCNRKVQVKESRVVFNGKREPVVSDHYGVMIEWNDESVR